MKIDKGKILLMMVRKAWSYEDLIKAYGCSKQRVCNIVNKRNLRPKTAGMLARALDVDVTEILANE